MGVTLSDITDFLDSESLNYKYYGDTSLEINGFCTLPEIAPNFITWIASPKRFELEQIKGTSDVLLIANNMPSIDYSQSNFLITEYPKTVFFEVIKKFFPECINSDRKIGIEKTAIIETDNIGDNVYIGHHCYICPEAIIGDNVTIMHNVVIESPCAIGGGSVIGSNSVIGTLPVDHYYKGGERQRVVPLGNVVIGKNVEIGADVIIQRGASRDTMICDGVIIAPAAVIGHDAYVGSNSLIISSVHAHVNIGENVHLGGCSINQVTIGEGAFISPGGSINRNVPPKAAVVWKSRGKIIKNGAKHIKNLKE